jgi:hypothetical protein
LLLIFDTPPQKTPKASAGAEAFDAHIELKLYSSLFLYLLSSPHYYCNKGVRRVVVVSISLYTEP